jgi:hypothetical protein
MKIFFTDDAFQKEVDVRLMFLKEEITKLNKIIDDLVEQLTAVEHKKASNYIKNKVTKKKTNKKRK